MNNAHPARSRRISVSVVSFACAGALGMVAWFDASVAGAEAGAEARAGAETRAEGVADAEIEMKVSATAADGAAPVATVPTASDAGALWGQYQHVGGSRESEKIKAAIERATESMAPGIRGIARNRLEASLKPYPTLRLDMREGKVFIEKEGEPGVRTAPDTPVQWKNGDGDQFTVRVRVRGDSLVETLKNAHTYSRVAYKLQSDTRLRVTTTIQDKRLPEKIQYTLVYSHE